METGGHPDGAVFVAADVHYLPAGGARAAAVLAADALFSRLAGDRIAVVPDVAPYQPGQFYLRELPPLHAVLDGLPGLSLLVIDGYADLVRQMAGRHRLPDALRRADTLARHGLL